MRNSAQREGVSGRSAGSRWKRGSHKLSVAGVFDRHTGSIGFHSRIETPNGCRDYNLYRNSWTKVAELIDRKGNRYEAAAPTVAAANCLKPHVPCS